LAVPPRRLGLVQALERAVHALVEAPAVLHRNPHLVELVERDPESLDGPLEQRGVGDLETEARLLEQLPRLVRLGLAGGAERDVDPAGETVLLVPGALAMAQEHELVHRRLTSRGVRYPR